MLIEAVIGNLDEPGRFAQLDAVKVDTLVLDRWEAQKHRLRKTTEGGTEVALSLDRDCRLRDGDILYWDRAAGTAIVARVELGEVMVVDLHPTDDSVKTAVEVGHALGNQHWPAVVKGARIYVPVAVDRAVLDSVMRTHAFPGVSYRFAPGAEVVADLTAGEARQLFGGADKEAAVGGADPPHTHSG
ncbi:urease accessory protein UreE [Planosporangium mesophilum]|uniref:Urease accessory protein UreE n=1 Tax=Planosporangium mesophilum TaxID=689768 RepID=A0A8J3TE79_9ACTN|nr:urease accessory protein UreE [Planosporangium mesophilum]NJC84558.1 urease accessory protein UreE [Planosporangium mesophilum]GII23866.1 urease accessory protein UreE [Planosporangium mesophilum]